MLRCYVHHVACVAGSQQHGTDIVSYAPCASMSAWNTSFVCLYRRGGIWNEESHRFLQDFTSSLSVNVVSMFQEHWSQRLKYETIIWIVRESNVSVRTIISIQFTSTRFWIFFDQLHLIEDYERLWYFYDLFESEICNFLFYVYLNIFRVKLEQSDIIRKWFLIIRKCLKLQILTRQ